MPPATLDLASLSSPPSASTSNSSITIDEPHPDAQIVGFQCLTDFNFRADLINHPSKKVDYPGNALVVTRIPNVPNEPGTEMVLHARTKRNILTSPRFLSPLPKQTGAPAFEIKDAGAPKGLGVFATRDLEIGDLIIAERALTIIPTSTDLGGVPNISSTLLEMSNWCYPKVPVGVAEAFLGATFARLSIEDKRAFLGLLAGSKDKRCGRLSSISQTNSIEITQFDDRDGAKKFNYAAIFKNTSRVNHSCVPNSHYLFDPASFALYLRAGKKIAKGDEITISYDGSTTHTTAERHEKLIRYSIDCSCPICSLPQQARELCDNFRAAIPSRVDALETKMKDINSRMRGAPQQRLYKEIGDKLYTEAKALTSEMERWGLDANSYYLKAVGVLMAALVGRQLSDPKYRAEAFAASAKQEALNLVFNGPEDE